MAEVKARLDTAGTCIEGVPRDVLEGFMVTRPRVFLMGEVVPQGAWVSAGSQRPQFDGNIVCKWVKEARRLFGCSSDFDAVQKMIQTPDLMTLVLTG